MKGFIKKMLVALAGATLVGVIAMPTNVKADSKCAKTGADICTGLCYYDGDTYTDCSGHKYKYKAVAISADKVGYCAAAGETVCWIDVLDAKNDGKTAAQRAEQAKKTAEMIAGYNDYFAGNAAATNEIAALYAVNPGMGLDAQLTYLANISIDSFNAQYAAFMQNNAVDLALYEAMTQAQ